MPILQDAEGVLPTRAMRVILFSVGDPIKVPPLWKQLNSEDGASKSSTAEGDPRRLSDDIPSLFWKADQAAVLLNVVEHSPEDVAWITNYLGTRHKSGQSLVEFP